MSGKSEKNNLKRSGFLKKDKFYLFSLIAISFIVFVIGYFNMNYLIKISTNQLLEIQIESSKREAREFSNLVAYQIENGISRDIVINNIQQSIEGTNTESGFICMFDWSGVEICHPDPQKIGKQTNPNESYVRPIDSDIDSEDFYQLLNDRKARGGVREFNDGGSSEIIYLYPVKNTDWIIASHANVDKIENEIASLRSNFLMTYLLTSISIILLSLIIVRYIGNYYEKELEQKNEKLTEEVLSLSKLNRNLSEYKTKISNENDEQVVVKNDENEANDVSNSKIKRRLLTYAKDKLITIRVDDIAYIHTENSITFITCLDGQQYTHNSSLDELFTHLDKALFFRANRQYILSVKGIDEILKYGNNQLKIKTIKEDKVLISKNKAAEFKKWLSI